MGSYVVQNVLTFLLTFVLAQAYVHVRPADRHYRLGAPVGQILHDGQHFSYIVRSFSIEKCRICL